MHSTIFGHSLSELKEGTFDLLDKRLGGMYRDGQGVLQDYQEVIKWCRLAAEQGMHEAQYDLGVRYYHGQGVPKDYKEAASGFDLPQIREMLLHNTTWV